MPPNHIVLKDEWRHKRFYGGKEKYIRCDRNILADEYKWYRFVGINGESLQIPLNGDKWMVSCLLSLHKM